MNVKESAIGVTNKIHFVLTIDPTEQCSLAAFAEFFNEQRLESTLLEAIIEIFNDVFVEAFCGENTHRETEPTDSSAKHQRFAQCLLLSKNTISPLNTSKTLRQ
jgi:hypothetical protein